jgi:hypothetical protein
VPVLKKLDIKVKIDGMWVKVPIKINAGERSSQA